MPPIYTNFKVNSKMNDLELQDDPRVDYTNGIVKITEGSHELNETETLDHGIN